MQSEREVSEKKILELEKKYWEAVKNRDVSTALSLTDDPCIIAGASGVAMIHKEAFVEIMKNAPYMLHRFELKDAKVRFITDDVAILAYEVSEDLTVEGKPVQLTAADASTWVRKNDRWVCALHTESLPGDPYGRSQSKAAA